MSNYHFGTGTRTYGKDVMTHLAPHSEPKVAVRGGPDPSRGRAGRAEVTTSYVIGLPRSGTTLLAYLLAGGDSQLALSEPYLALDILRWPTRPWLFRRLARKAGLRSIRMPAGRDESVFARFLEDFAAKNKLSHLVIKETYRASREWSNAARLTRLVASNDNVIAIQRHPYDVAVSSIRFCRYWRGIPGRLLRVLLPRLPLFATDQVLVEHVADEWRSFYHWCKRHRLVVIRYEDLTARPEVELSRACEACGVPFQQQMLDHEHPRGAFGGIGAPEVLNRPPRPVSTQSVGRKKQLPEPFWAIMTERCGKEAGLMGYDM